MPHLRGEFLQEFTDLTASIVDTVAADVRPDVRAKLSERLAGAFCALWAGAYIYVPHGVSLPRVSPDYKSRRDAAIRDEHDVSALSVHRLSRRYGLSEITIYRILAQSADTDAD